MLPMRCGDMKKELLDVIFASKKRKDVLLLLQKEPQDTESLLKSLGTTRQSLLPQIKILEESHFVVHYKDTYELTTIGKLVVDEMLPLLDTIEFLDNDIDYWGTHNLDFIPPDLLKRVSELGNCRVITPPVTEIHQISNEFQESSKNSTSIFTITSFFHPNFPELLSELIKNNATIHTIISKDLLENLRAKHALQFKKLFESKLINIYVYPKQMQFMSFAYNDYQIMMLLLKSNGEISNKHFLCSNPESLYWAKDLYDYYLKDSIPITEL